MGSPPHMRGKEAARALCGSNAGITPAHAGKRFTIRRVNTLTRDHPRTCGEKVFAIYPYATIRESPPHMRGKASEDGGRKKPPGITPAHAGKSRGNSDPYVRLWDHPRTCGEKLTNCSKLIAEAGSPPHMRGKGLRRKHKPGHIGITPAHAGKSYLCEGLRN